MIVISGALVVVALILLIAGLAASSGLGFVWASIVASVVAGVFLAIGVYQRRGEVPADATATPAEPASSDSDTVRTVKPATAASSASESASGSATVYVVEGRPRYHAEGCRYLAGKDSDTRTLDAARSEGYSACGVCKPDASAESAPAATPASADEETTVVPVMASSGTRTTSGTAKRSTAKKSPAKKAAAASKTATKKATTTTPAKKVAVKKTAVTPAAKKTTAKKTTAKKTTAKKTTAKKTSGRNA